MKILICGDSFAADWRIEYPNSQGWPILLESNFQVTNLAQAGCSQYKILLQLKTVNLFEFDFIIISHTSPYRLYVKSHPIHKTGIHQQSDLIYADIKEHSKKEKKMLPIVEYFENYLDLDYMQYIHNLICEDIAKLVSKYRVIHSTHFEWDNSYEFNSMLNFNEIYKKHKGLINHYSDEGNKIIYTKLLEKLNESQS